MTEETANIDRLVGSDVFLLSVAGQVREQIANIMDPMLPDGVEMPELTVDQVRPLVSTLATAMTAAVDGPALGTSLLSGNSQQIAVRVFERDRPEWKIMNLDDGSIEYNTEAVLPGSWSGI